MTAAVDNTWSTSPTSPHPWRRQQASALAALDATWAQGQTRAWVVLPPGGGKTYVGLEAARRLGRTTLILGPNTAIQGQWLATAATFHPPLPAADTRDLREPITCLTYQALAVFDGEIEDTARHIDRLSDSGKTLLANLTAAGPVTLVLDEAHHLLATWGELLDEILTLVPDAHVIGLTGTPPDAMTADEAALIDRLFGPIRYAASIPGFVRDGHLAPFRELAWITEPTDSEKRYIAAEAERFNEMITDLLDPTFASHPFLGWLDRRLSQPTTANGQPISWARIERDQPALAQAALRAAHAGLTRTPAGARIREQHRAPMDADDWAALIGDYARLGLEVSTDPRDEAAFNRLKNALPAVGYRLTRRGVVRTTSPVDRVIARSASKAAAAVTIARHEWTVRADGLRALVLTDYERASAQIPARLVGVIDPDEGSARSVIAALAADPTTVGLDPVMMTGQTVACSRATATRLIPWLRTQDPNLRLTDIDLDGPWDSIVEITGSWNSRRWVPLITRWLDDGHGHVIVGTRSLLGEGWDARSVNVLIDLTAATTSIAVAQTRGRALRVDPRDPTKVAHNWSVACLAYGHPKGDADWQRLVRKHHGFLAVTHEGFIADGVAHIDPDLSEHEPPAPDQARALNARMLSIAANPAVTRDLWAVGRPYADERVHEVRVGAGRHLGVALPAVANGRYTSERTGSHTVTPEQQVRLGGTFFANLTSWVTGGKDIADASSHPCGSVEPIAGAVADALHATGLTSGGAAQVRVAPRPDGTYRVWLDDVPESDSAVFAEALDEALAPMAAPRYVIGRSFLAPVGDAKQARRVARRRFWGRPVATLRIFHAVPTVLASNAHNAKQYEAAWNRWVSPGTVLYTGGAEGAAVLAAQGSDDPFNIETAQRIDWR